MDKNQIFLKFTLRSAGNMDSDHGHVDDALHKTFPSFDGSGLIRRGYQLLIRVDGISAVTQEQMDYLRARFQATDSSVIEADEFWSRA